jgi:hypothetical protein
MIYEFSKSIIRTPVDLSTSVTTEVISYLFVRGLFHYKEYTSDVRSYTANSKNNTGRGFVLIELLIQITKGSHVSGEKCLERNGFCNLSFFIFIAP